MSACLDNSCYDFDRTQVVDHLLFNYVQFSRPNFPNVVTCAPVTHQDQNTFASSGTIDDGEYRGDEIWLKVREEAQRDVEQEPILSGDYFCTILAHDSLEKALATHLATKLSNSSLSSNTLVEIFFGVFKEDPEIRKAIRDDLRAAKECDPVCISYVQCLLHFKGFQACQAHRVAHKLWSKGRNVLALLIQNRVSEVFAVDIHPGAKIGRGILLDHATGIVIGETAVVGNNVSILHNVTLGGTGKQSGDRHPKIGDGVLVGAGTQVLGNVRIGEGAKIGAGSVVLKEVPAWTTVVGNPARLLGGK
ncbi:serine acetyltransferase 1, chloroplastic-like [Telopea speciosissima]|uniref:serine acetyltransferase 1, chloroplastic-like n=1 Tax=Telopea speciosissima TaxID=54955 RepID=UPI001CC6E2D1|nr:serine acetyltransferase 1, chloroplastic-like [Telopea speciosissima]